MAVVRELRYKLQKRANNLRKADYQTMQNELVLFMKFCERQGAVKAILERLREQPIYGSDWRIGGRGFDTEWPEKEEEKAAVCLSILDEGVGPEATWEFPFRTGWPLAGSSSRLQDHAHAFVDHILEPVYQFIDERLDDYDFAAHMLVRFKARCEWFERARLFTQYQEDTAHGEANLDKELRRFLFDQGIDYPLSQPESPSGRTDVLLTELGSDKPLALEVKLFDADNYGRPYITQGFRQVCEYMDDYQATVGYLVIFNLSEKDLKFEGAEDSSIPVKVQAGNRTVLVLVLDIFPHPEPASRRGQLEVCSIPISALTGEEDETGSTSEASSTS